MTSGSPAPLQSVVISVPSKAGSLPSLVPPAVQQYQVRSRVITWRLAAWLLLRQHGRG
jgi:hypothetical protein